MPAASRFQPRSPGTSSLASTACSSPWLTRRLADCSATPNTDPHISTEVSGGPTPEKMIASLIILRAGAGLASCHASRSQRV